jgi:phosphoribosylcarboxyaminoimidazole (NCAIR) mutase
MMQGNDIGEKGSFASVQGDSNNKNEKFNTTPVCIIAPSLKLLDKMKDAITILDALQVPYSIAIIGVPLRGDSLDGVDSLYSIVQMPRGVPVGTMGIDCSYNAGIFACQILTLKYPHLKQKMVEYKRILEKEVEAEDAQLSNDTNKQKGKYSKV